MSVSGRVDSSHYICFRFLGYADGPLFVRVSMAMDAIIADLVENLKEIVWVSIQDRSHHIPWDHGIHALYIYLHLTPGASGIPS